MLRAARLLLALAALPRGESAALRAVAEAGAGRGDVKPKHTPPIQRFRNVLLVIHCRLKFHWPKTICDERKPLYTDYSRYFGDVMYVTRDTCEPRGDPYLCLANIMQKEGADRDGVFYMHFDALIAPRRLAQVFDKEAVGLFSGTRACKVGAAGGLEQEQSNCSWNNWAAKGASYLRALDQMHPSVESSRQILSEEVLIGNDDLFYIPRAAFSEFARLAHGFAEHEVHHELAGPAIRQAIQGTTGRPPQNYNCSGSCCTTLRPEVALTTKFHCGHVFDLRENRTRNVFKAVISLS